MDYLPSKKFVSSVATLLVIVLAGYFAHYVWISKTTTHAPQKNKVSDANYTKSLAEANADTDNDSLKNWEESLWRTDPLRADTDGDGTSDGDEVKVGRDPLVIGKENSKGSGAWTDQLSKPELLTINSGASTMTLNFTQQMAAQFANTYFAVKGSAGDQPLTDVTKASLANGISKEVEKKAASYQDIYTEKDLKISQFAGVRTYLSDLSDAFDKIFKNVTELELQFVTSAAQSGDTSQIGKLDANITAYKKMAEYLKNREVPAAYAKTHLILLNLMNNTAVAVDLLKHIKDDPMSATIGVKLYYNQITATQNFFLELYKQTQADGIDFADGQEGTFFNKYFVKKS